MDIAGPAGQRARVTSAEARRPLTLGMKIRANGSDCAVGVKEEEERPVGCREGTSTNLGEVVVAVG